MAKNMIETLESLSGYRHAFELNDPNVANNPVNYSHLILTVGGRKYHVLSRICDAGIDYTQRTNKLAHHVVLTDAELTTGGPAWVLSQNGFCVTEWVGDPRTLPQDRTPDARDRMPEVCRAWQAATGDAGWGGVLAESFLEQPPRTVSVIFKPGQDLLPLVVESLALIPEERRWDVTFSTYFTRLPAGVDCHWRFLLDGSPEVKAVRSNPHLKVIDLTTRLERAVGGDLVEAARRGLSIRKTQPAASIPPKAAQSRPANDSHDPTASESHDAESATKEGPVDEVPIHLRSEPPPVRGRQTPPQAPPQAPPISRPVRRRKAKRGPLVPVITTIAVLLAIGVGVFAGVSFYSHVLDRPKVASPQKTDDSLAQTDTPPTTSPPSGSQTDGANGERLTKEPAQAAPATDPSKGAKPSSAGTGSKSATPGPPNEKPSTKSGNPAPGGPKAQSPVAKTGTPPQPQLGMAPSSPPKVNDQPADPFRDIVQKGKRLSIPSLKQIKENRYNEQKVANVSVVDPSLLDLKIVGQDVVFGEKDVIALAPKRSANAKVWALDLEDWRDIGKPKVTVATLTLKERGLYFSWDRRVEKYLLDAYKIRLCCLALSYPSVQPCIAELNEDNVLREPFALPLEKAPQSLNLMMDPNEFKSEHLRLNVELEGAERKEHTIEALRLSDAATFVVREPARTDNPSALDASSASDSPSVTVTLKFVEFAGKDGNQTLRISVTCLATSEAIRVTKLENKTPFPPPRVQAASVKGLPSLNEAISTTTRQSHATDELLKLAIDFINHEGKSGSVIKDKRRLEVLKDQLTARAAWLAAIRTILSQKRLLGFRLYVVIGGREVVLRQSKGFNNRPAKAAALTGPSK
jgi:hypothetical protein